MSGSTLGKRTGNLYETKTTYVWKISETDFSGLIVDEKIDSPTFSTFAGNALSNWHLRLFLKGISTPKHKITSIFLRHDGQANIYAAIRFFLLNNDGQTLYDRVLPRQKILKQQILYTPLSSLSPARANAFLQLGCEITFEPDDCDQLEQKSLPNTIQRLREFDEFEKLLSEPRFADVTFQVANDDREPLLAHRNILSARSPVFEAIFAQEMPESARSCINIEYVAYDVLKELLRYLYTAKLHENLGLNMVTELLVAAEKYKVEGLKTRCEKMLGDGLTAANALRFLTLADTHNATELGARCIAFIVANSEEIVDSEDFKLYGELHPAVICQIFQAVVRKNTK